MKRKFFTNLPSEITTDVLSRLPLRSIALSKCVCKPWLNLLDFDDFKFKTPPALALLQQTNSTRCSIFEFEDKDEFVEEKSHDLHYIPLTHFEIRDENSEILVGMAANGLLLIHSQGGFPQIPLFICNPITHQYIELWCPEEYILDDDDVHIMLSYGFGMSKISGQYKVLCKYIDASSDSYRHVYTLGTGTWRLVEAGAVSGFGTCLPGYFGFNGILHWVGGEDDLAHTLWVCCFDLENECYDIFSPPPPPPVDGHGRQTRELSTLMDCLCYSYTWEDDIVIWLMKEYQVEESWTNLHKISRNGFDLDWDFASDWKYMGVKPIRLFKDGDVLMLLDQKKLIYYSNKTKTIQQVGMLNDATAQNYVSAMIFTPSLFSFKNFVFENVISF
ncbi:F-box protein At3g07870-like [Salvia hispanica]|uniref:F-box protein At3g07870-like n=1 Tax=Salvia hispanica TaxID=49212 RepID=UPI0020090B5F|nr:F-box protein At3g07870-like [Salvia hispanica]